MAKEITTINTAIYETTGNPGPRVLHEVANFEILGTLCHVRTSPDGDLLFLRVGRRDFAVSLLDLAANAALAVEKHLKAEIRARVLGRHKAPDMSAQQVPIRGVVESDGFITLHSSRRG